MNRLRLTLRSLAYYRRTHAGVAAGAAVTAAVLSGALIVGDSISHTLQAQASLRIGAVDQAMFVNDRLFRADLADRIEAAFEDVDAAPVLLVRGVASSPDGSRTARQVNIYGIDHRFFDFAPVPRAAVTPNHGEALLNDRLAVQLAAANNDEVVVRVQKPSALPRDSVLGTIEDMSLGLRVTVAGVASDEAFGRFGLEANQIPPHNMFVPIDWLQQQMDAPGRANTLLVRGGGEVNGGRSLSEAVPEVLTLEDYQLRIRAVLDSAVAELVSDRIFIGAVEEAAIARCESPLLGILTYFVNQLSSGERATPYSIVTAIGPLRERDHWPGENVMPFDAGPDDVVINSWLADDLHATDSASLTMRFFALTGESEKLTEQDATFRVRRIAEIAGLAADRTLMPDFPGIADAEDSRDWQPGIPIDLGRIRDTDEDYWDAYRGTPKAFISLERGRELWQNRYGGLTAVRFDAAAESEVRDVILSEIDAQALGFIFRDVRGPASRAAKSTTDFGGLFLGLSIFLIAAALLLTALLFALNADQRSTEVGTLLALGFAPRDVRRMLVLEGAVIALVGAVAGAGLGVLYTLAVLSALRSIWSDAVASAEIDLAITPMSLSIGVLATFIISLLAMWLTLGHTVKQPPTRLMGRSTDAVHFAGVRSRPWITTVLSILAGGGAIVLVLSTGLDQRQASLTFFGAGALLLICGLLSSRLLLRFLRENDRRQLPSIGQLAMRNTTRRSGRSLTTVSLLACGVFLVLAIAANRLDAHLDASARDSGTGGFAFYGESTIPVLYDLNEQRGRDSFSLTEGDLAGVSVVPMRVQDGDDASCLNLNLAQRPRLLGVDPESLQTRGAFTFVRTHPDLSAHSGWHLLDAELPDGAVPAVVDDASATWALHKSIGDTIEYVGDDGTPFDVMIVGTIGNSILQGSLVVADRHLRDRFESQTGTRTFLIDCPNERREEVATRLHRALSDVGLELTPAAQRLADFNAVQNAYLAIFQMLGGLGLLLGSVGLGLIVVRNILERRSELALLRAVGFNLGAVRSLVRREHFVILSLGLGNGTLASILAVLPALRRPTAELPTTLMLILLGMLTLNGIFWVWLATRLTVRGDLQNALRNE